MNLDKEHNKFKKVSSMSVYGKEFPNYGKIESKLVFRRPEEKYYPLGFAEMP
jgi:hypothetical protein